MPPSKMDARRLLEEYAIAARTGTTTAAGLKEVLPFARHFYILHRVIGTNPKDMCTTGRKLFYQIPFSEWNTLKKNMPPLIAPKVNNSWSYPPLSANPSKDSKNWHSANHCLAEESFCLPFNKTAGIHEILQAWQDREDFIDSQKELQRTLTHHLNKKKTDYPASVWA